MRQTDKDNANDRDREISGKLIIEGVVLTHENLIATSTSIMFLDGFNDKDVYIGYLPLAHVLELLAGNRYINYKCIIYLEGTMLQVAFQGEWKGRGRL